jgi:hypothetical protein
LVAAGTITQHVLFPLFTALTLFFLGLFGRTLDRRYWYAAAASLGLGFATVETSFLLVGAVLVSLVAMHPRVAWKEMPRLALRGAAVFLLTVSLVWPKGLFMLGAAKGYLYLAYMALFRKTLAPVSPLQLWAHKFTAYPYEFVLVALALGSCLFFYRRLSCREESKPFLLYAGLFIIATSFVTLNYTYYHTSLLLVTSVLIGVMAGEAWNRSRAAGGVVAAASVASLASMAVIYHHEATVTNLGLFEHRAAVIDYVKNSPATTYYVPHDLVPPLHYYAAQAKTIAYDDSWAPDTLVRELSAPGAPKQLLCAATLCAQVRGKLQEGHIRETQIAGPSSDLREPFFAITAEPSRL